ncbi:helix-turn-helix domain-containing protein [Paenibacillus sacheonensis]|uniref:Helix-turn-helix domain-containing protein n=1 Tax=Paenibacillus sacheonensis TaxID=742054 RepID=A0A7X4YTU2_9BACL|nr:helix-turn-helix domain-containing protein [Paenibacillus sacheonensis]MBM7568646.1 two-component system response regulator YesN [Paenibacillus sacheonensis]NBC72462.1 helix-turn-helix domain-containing protein [Paenibacillus sacheonensis]
MYNMLIVDDEKYAAEGILHCHDWSALGIESVRTAGSAGEARAVLLERRVDILVCDIEMPDEDGLSLVRWAKEYSPHTEAVFLTCHSEFAYAKEAFQLKSFDYLLKPVDSDELAGVVKQMLDAIRSREEQSRHAEQFRQYQTLWSKQQPVLAERFWRDLLSRRILSFGDFLERALQDAQIALPPGAKVLPILISIEEWQRPLHERDQEIMAYAVKKAAEELLLDGRPGHVVTDKNDVPFVMCYASEAEQARLGSEHWAAAGSRFIEACASYFYGQVSCYVGICSDVNEVPECCDRLREMERHNLTSSGAVHLYSGTAVPDSAASAYAGIDISEWSSYMIGGHRDRILGRIQQICAGLEKSTVGGEKQLEMAYQDLLQVIYHFLGVKGLSVHEVPSAALWLSTPVRSLAQYKHWAVNLVSAVMDAVLEESEQNGFARQALSFVKANVEEDISREDVAAHVGLNPAYLSRLFKKETGKNLIDYLIECKMNRAKQLMDATGMTVSMIAQQVGYANFSHFTKTFRKYYGVNPQEYRSGRG